MHVDKNETKYKNRPSPYILSRKPIMLPTLISLGSWPAMSRLCRGPACYLQQQSRQQSNHFCNGQPRMARTSLIMKSFPSFCLCFQLGINQRKPNVTPNQSHWMSYFWLVHLQPPPQQPPIRAHWKPPFSHYKAGSLLCLLLSLCPDAGDSDGLPFQASSE